MNTPPHLPADQYLAALLGITVEEYKQFKYEAYKRAKIEPGTPIAGTGAEVLAIISLVTTIISIGLTIAASFFKPKEEKAGRLKVNQKNPDNITRDQKFSPRFGFDSVQEAAVLGTTIPVVYTNRTTYTASEDPPRPAGKYGGIRVNLQLIWSQLLSLGGDQFLRAIFLLGEANTASIEGLAIGDNPVGSYDLIQNEAMQQGAKLTVYYRSAGGRILPSDYVWGRDPSTDPGNAVISGGADVYEIVSRNQQFRPDFCFTSKPSTSTVFGLSKWLPNGTAYRMNPVISPTGSLTKNPDNDNNKYDVHWLDDPNTLCTVWKYKYHWSRRCGVISPTGEYNVGDTFQYTLSRIADTKTEFKFNEDNARLGDVNEKPGKSKCQDIASAVASQQNTAFEALIEGDLFKFGSLLAVLIARSPSDKVFVSNSENEPPENGQSITYTFKVVRAGYIQQAENIDPPWSGDEIMPPRWDYVLGESLAALQPPIIYPTVSGMPQGFRCDIADITLNRAARVFEIGLKSSVGIKINGFCNFKDANSYKEVNDKAGGDLHNEEYGSQKDITVHSVTSGVINCSEERYSFFRISCRPDTESDFVFIPASFAVRSKTSQPVYNYIRFEMSSEATWQFRFEPISSWELRSARVSSPFIVLDSKSTAVQTITRQIFDGVDITWNGTTVRNISSTFRLKSIEPSGDKGIGFSDPEYAVMTDPWGKAAEAFCYDQIQTTCSEGPEHEIVYINTITKNDNVPLYTNLAIVGLNIRAARQWSQLAQVSVYVSKGRTVRRLLNNDSYGASNLFPDIFRDLLLSPVFGMGDSITEEQIDTNSFIAAAEWCRDRRYFFDGVIADKTNLRQWAADTAGSMLLELLQRDGRFALEPAVLFPESGPVPIRALFTVGNIVENSFAMEFLSEEDRQPIQVSVKWREERFRDNYATSGMFPVEREVLVREASASDTDPIESFDLTQYCTNFEHAVDFACYVIRVRRLITHSIKFSTTPDGIDAGLRAGDYIKVALDFTFYDEFANGVILDNGTIVSTRPDLLPTGVHQAVYWDGTDSPIVEGTITVDAAGLGSPTGVVFIKKNVNSQVRVYKVESITLGEDGIIELEAVHHPVDNSGISLIGKQWTTYTTNSEWVIERT